MGCHVSLTHETQLPRTACHKVLMNILISLKCVNVCLMCVCVHLCVRLTHASALPPADEQPMHSSAGDEVLVSTTHTMTEKQWRAVLRTTPAPEPSLILSNNVHLLILHILLTPSSPPLSFSQSNSQRKLIRVNRCCLVQIVNCWTRVRARSSRNELSLEMFRNVNRC